MSHNEPEASSLASLVDRAWETLARTGAPRLWEASRSVTVRVPTSSAALVPFNRVYADEVALAAAVERRDGPLRIAAIALVAEIDRKAAAALVADVLATTDVSAAAPDTFEGSIGRTVGYVFPVLVDDMAPLAVRDLWLLGRVKMSVVTDAALAATPVASIVRACLEARGLDLDAERLLAAHTGLAGGDGARELLDALRGSPHYDLICRLIDSVGTRKDARALPALLGLATGGDSRYHAPAAEAVLAIGTREAYEALAGLLDGAEEREGTVRAAARAAIELDPSTSTTRLERHLTTASLTTPRGLRVARGILGAPIALLRRDPRWLDLLARRLNDNRLGARSVLAQYDVADVEAALRRVKADTREPARASPSVPAMPRWLERYRAGEHAAVWREIVALEGAVRDPVVLPEAEAVAREIMTRARENLARIVRTLKKGKYRFRVGGPAKALVAPGPKLGKQLDRMEALLGGPLPLSVRVFYEIVGGVNLQEEVDPDYEEETFCSDIGQYEALSVAPAKEMLAHLEEDAKAEQRYPEVLRRPPSELYFSDDPLFKQWPDEHSNDSPVFLSVSQGGADGLAPLPFRQPEGGEPETDREQVGLVDYLRRYVLAGGFLWLASPVDEGAGAARDVLTRELIPF